MNKSQLVDAVAQSTELTKLKSAEVIEAVLASITGSLKSGESVTLVGFGTFSVAQRNARNGRNPITGKTIKIAAKKAPKFSAGKALKETVNGPKPKAK
jgi:DNA-binding protein HU-beta